MMFQQNIPVVTPTHEELKTMVNHFQPVQKWSSLPARFLSLLSARANHLLFS
jgi:hypothetical protein